MADIPILMLTARGEETDRVVGLEIGADDYLSKPFSSRELLARLRALLRRRGAQAGAPAVLRFGHLEIDRGSRAVKVDGHDAPLTSYQFDLLVALAEHAGRVLSREQLMDLVKGEELEAFDRSIDVHVSRILAASSPCAEPAMCSPAARMKAHDGPPVVLADLSYAAGQPGSGGHADCVAVAPGGR